ncbi:extracellular solute-binding protein [Streptococcus sp. FT1-106]|uniref:extracellular solute-binding protein n=1 Tax=Streptococcus sp. FT1-106 TaxID=3409994 RepID=UPI003BF58294
MKKNTWKKVVTSGVALASIATLAACSSNGSKESTSSDKVSLKLWVPTDAKESYEATVKAFEKAEGVSVKIVESNDSKAQENVKKDPEKAADVFSLPHDQLGQLVESGVILEIPEKYATEVADNNVENAVAGAQYKGKTYAFPFGVESQVLFYNKSKLSADDVKSYETITSKATFGASLKEVNAYATAPLMLSVGNTLFGEDGETVDGTNWGNDKGVAVMQWLADQKDNKGFVNVTDAEAVSKFGDGTVAAIETGPWNYSAAEEAVGKDNLGIAVYPTVTIGGDTVQQKAFMGVKLYAVNQAPAKGDAKRIAASYKLAAYLTNAESQENQFKTRNIIPSNKEVQSSDAVTSNELAKAVSSMTGSVDYTTVMPKLNQMATFWTESASLLSGPYSGKIAPADFLAKLQQFDKDLAATK